ncbi:MAG: hypothetical protein LBS16_04435 [Prevotellaceae bacterium]|jgi:hypothetical protein|nr:hypothetical protein [Prevotellaceae bacterium]
MATKKNVIRVENKPSSASSSSGKVFTPTAEAKGKASQNRLLAIVLWALAVVAEVVAMVILFKKDPEIALTTGKRVMLIVILLVDLVLLIAGSGFWKKANRLNPPSKASALFGIQSQLGIIMAAVCFLPVVILAFIKKEYLVGAIAAAFMVGGGAASADYNPASQEQYAAQTSEVETLTGKDFVYWTKSGTKFHLYDDCRYINTAKTTDIYSGTVAQARELKNITELCSACKDRVMKEKGISEEQLQQAQQAAANAIEGTQLPTTEENGEGEQAE